MLHLVRLIPVCSSYPVVKKRNHGTRGAGNEQEIRSRIGFSKNSFNEMRRFFKFVFY